MESRYGHFTVLISSIRRLVLKIKDMEMSEFGLKGTHLTCMFYISILRENGECVTATDLCKVSGEDKAAISRAVKDLETSGFLIQEGDTKKKYRANLKLTQKGLQIVKVADEKISYYEDFASQDLSEKEREKLYRALESIEKNLSKVCEDKHKNN